MSSYINFKNIGDPSQPEGSGAKPAGNFSLAGQSSLYSLTFDELQSTFSGAGKDFGSMNMDEFLKNIWTSDGAQPIASSSGFGEGISVSSGNLQKQGSLSLPRTLSQKTVDEVLKDLLKEGDRNGNGSGGANLLQRQGTLGEMTLEEFLSKAGVVGEATLPTERSNNGGYYALSASGIMSQQQVQQQQRQQPLFPKQATVAFSSPNNLVNNSQLASPGTRGPAVGMTDHSISNSLAQNRVIQSGAMGMANIAPRATTIAIGSPKTQLMPNVITKSDVDTSSFSPSPYAFNEGSRGRKPSGVLEKVVERRRKRMIKNRESAARSRARKQAYTLELEAEVAKLKKVIIDLEEKQKKFKEMQKNQAPEKMKYPWGGKRLCLRRTLTGPW
ncbi:ABSCISIC ACID-INSENSITIVE 5-like protein 7 isoform X2 [Daucus carota subsp. sativus]|uniref:ABSCISIC ACID-INSENSITIVE 5-like protein 7 isoform X2 n=1 Tax=Daucus carota subsp. sativus TaxID=79200 RepID=UPI0007EF98E7|nr:PREDICTED: ABSCISIC ACID-INSENSITIVE 5-like protein 7 isoform X2 [Daucus carota subsp. sativus]